MAIGVWLHLTQHHEHEHVHEPMRLARRIVRRMLVLVMLVVDMGVRMLRHERLKHSHPHVPDMHHQHNH